MARAGAGRLGYLRGRDIRLRARADERLRVAQEVLRELGLLERWARYGEPGLVGSVALGLVVEPDIDLEIECAEADVAHGFSVLAACAAMPGVRKARFANALDLADRGLYYQLRYERAGREWKIDMWALPRDNPGPRGSDLVGPMLRTLTDETRDAILAIKEAAVAGGEAVQGIWVYRAVLEAGVRDHEAYRAWIAGRSTDGLTYWHP